MVGQAYLLYIIIQLFCFSINCLGLTSGQSCQSRMFPFYVMQPGLSEFISISTLQH